MRGKTSDAADIAAGKFDGMEEGKRNVALVYIVEDDNDIAEIEGLALKNSGFNVEKFVNAKDFFHKMKEEHPDLILLDIMLPGEDGLSILKKIRNVPETRHIPIILVTAKGTELDKVKGLDQGADDYLAKPFGVMELISRVKALLRRSSGMADMERLAFAGLALDMKKHEAFSEEGRLELTYKEFELLRYLMQNAGSVLSRDAIMERVWGADYEGESRTLDMHIKTLRQKLGGSGTLIKTVRNVGYCLGEKS